MLCIYLIGEKKLTLLEKPTAAFAKIKTVMIQLIPIFGAFVGFIAIRFIGSPIAIGIKNFMQKQFKVGTGSTRAGVTKADFTELLWWVPTGLIIGVLASLVGIFARSLGETGQIIGNFLLGFGVGAMIGSLIMPFAEDIPIIGQFLMGA